MLCVFENDQEYHVLRNFTYKWIYFNIFWKWTFRPVNGRPIDVRLAFLKTAFGFVKNAC